MLLSTSGQQKVEATYDTMWGTGVPLHQRHCLDTKKWKNVGLLGSMLMKVHAQLSSSGGDDSSLMDAGTYQ